jgi:hypothetical protein
MFSLRLKIEKTFYNLWCEMIFQGFFYVFFIFLPSSLLANSHILRSVRWTLDFADAFLSTNTTIARNLFMMVRDWNRLLTSNYRRYSSTKLLNWMENGPHQAAALKKFSCSDSELTITWYTTKQNSLILHGQSSSGLANVMT